jgi:hypothetical protein
MAKRASGAERRKRARLIKSGVLRPGKLGRPKGTTARTQNRRSKVRKHLAWWGEPRSSDSFLATELLKHRDFEGVSKRVLRRDIAIIEDELWGPKETRGHLPKTKRGQFAGRLK